MNMQQTIEADLTKAMKSGDTERAETLKMVKSDLMYEKAKTGKDLSDETMLEVVSRAAKRRRESIAEFEKGNRQDLANKEKAELAIIETYLPAQMSAADIEKAIDEKLKAIGGVSQKDFGRVMGEIMKELKGKADGAEVRKILQSKVQA